MCIGDEQPGDQLPVGLASLVVVLEDIAGCRSYCDVGLDIVTNSDQLPGGGHACLPKLVSVAGISRQDDRSWPGCRAVILVRFDNDDAAAFALEFGRQLPTKPAQAADDDMPTPPPGPAQSQF